MPVPIHRLALTVAMCLAAQATVVWAQDTSASLKPASLRGMVLDGAGRPLPAVSLSMVVSGLSTSTDTNGNFAFAALPPGRQAFLLRRVGFRPASHILNLPPGETTLVAFAMTASARELDTVVVSEALESKAPRLVDFERRRNSGGGGTFITRAEIERRAPVDLVDILRRVPSIRIVDSLGVPLVVSRRGMRLDRRRNVGTAPCVLRVAVDGVVMPPEYPINAAVVPGEVAGIEVYAGAATVPIQFGSIRTETTCGLIMIWTRDG